MQGILRQAVIHRFGEDNVADHFADTSDTLCYATNENQSATLALIEDGGDVALIVGGYNSSNTSHLVELCEKAMPTYFIGGPDSIGSRSEIQHFDVHAGRGQDEHRLAAGYRQGRPLDIVLTAGASCPDALLDGVIRLVHGWYSRSDSHRRRTRRIQTSCQRMSESPESSTWYAEWFDRSEYDIVYKRRDMADARRLLDTVLRATGAMPGSRVLDMACGRGRHSIELASRGFEVTGIDLSPNAIETALAAAAVKELDVDFRVADMRDHVCSGCFDLVVNLFTSFGYFQDDADSEQSVLVMADALDHGGWLVQDFMNGAYWAKHFVPFDERNEDGIHLTQRRWLEEGRLNKEITLTGENGSRRSFTESVRLFDLDDFRRMHEAGGLVVERVFGDSDGRPFDENSRRLVILSKKP